MESNKPPLPGRPLTDRELLALPDRGPLREAFGDRYFWPLIALLGVGISFIQWLLDFPVGPGLISIGLWGWVREARKR